MRRKQRGITFIGWVFLLVPMAIVGYAGLRLVPIYLNYMSVARSIEQTGQEVRADDSAQNIRFALEKHLDVEGVSFPLAKDFAIQRDGPAWVLGIEYEDAAPLVSNVQVMVSFKKSVRIGKAAD
jgi:hypothetical protein